MLQRHSRLEQIGVPRTAQLLLAVTFLCACSALLARDAHAQAKSLTTIDVQAIHASPESTLDVVDFYGDDSRLANNLRRYEATPFSKLVGGSAFRYIIARSSSTSPVSDSLVVETKAAVDQSSVMVALVGVSNPPVDYNPDTVDVSLRLSINSLAQRENPNPGTILLNILHAAPNGRATWFSAGWTTQSAIAVADSLTFGSYSDYIEVPIDSSAEHLYFYPSTGGPYVGCGDAISQNDACLRVSTSDLLSTGNVFTLVVEELDPDDDELAGGTAVFPNGATLPVFVFGNVGVDEERGTSPGSLEIYPMPAGDRATFRFENSVPTTATLEIRDILGRVVLTRELGPRSSGANQFSIDTGRLASGLYFCRLLPGRADGGQPLRGRLLVTH